MTLSGRIIYSLSGFYYVEAADAVFECKARGSFRNKKIIPLTGDYVTFNADGKKGIITDIAERKNSLLRPPVANVDKLFIVSSLVNPEPDFYLIDKMSAIAVKKGIEPVIVFSKCDLADSEYFSEVYRLTPFKVICCSAVTEQGLNSIKECLNGNTCVFTGNSGVGKSSLLNALSPELSLKTNEISLKLGRGRHTTRAVHLYKIAGGMAADTPGFAVLEADSADERIEKDELAACFPEFLPFTESCRFMSSCSHIADKGCAVVQAVADGIISQERHASYSKMYSEIKERKKWE